MYSKWFGQGGCGPATKGRKGGINFHGFPEKEAAEHYLSIPNVEAANQWAKTHGKGGEWKDHAPKIEPVIDTNDLPPFAEFLPLVPGLLTEGNSTSGVSTPAESPPQSEFNSDNEDTNYDVLFTSDLIAEARQQLMQLCVSIAKTQLGPDKDLGKLSLLWLQRAQASQKGAVAHFMQKLLKSKAIDTAISAYKTLASSLNDNTWKYVFETRDLLRTDNLTATIKLDRSSQANEVLTDKNGQLQARIEQLESTVDDLNNSNKCSLKLITSLEKKLIQLQNDKVPGVCCQCEGKVSHGRGVVCCKFCSTGLGEWGGDPTTWCSEEVNNNNITELHDEAATAHAEEIAADTVDQKEELDRVEAENRLDAERLEQIQELVAASLEHLAKKEKVQKVEVKLNNKKKKKKKKAQSTDDERGSSSAKN